MLQSLDHSGGHFERFLSDGISSVVDVGTHLRTDPFAAQHDRVEAATAVCVNGWPNHRRVDRAWVDCSNLLCLVTKANTPSDAAPVWRLRR
jgi:hypothetical protein